MKWTSWADHAFEHKLRMENWDEAMAAAEQIPKKGFAMTTFSSEVLKRMLPPLEARFRVPNSDEADEEDSNTDAEDAGVDPEDSIRIVSWSEGASPVQSDPTAADFVYLSFSGDGATSREAGRRPCADDPARDCHA